MGSVKSVVAPQKSEKVPESKISFPISPYQKQLILSGWKYASEKEGEFGCGLFSGKVGFNFHCLWILVSSSQPTMGNNLDKRFVNKMLCNDIKSKSANIFKFLFE